MQKNNYDTTCVIPTDEPEIPESENFKKIRGGGGGNSCCTMVEHMPWNWKVVGSKEGVKLFLLFLSSQRYVLKQVLHSVCSTTNLPHKRLCFEVQLEVGQA